MWELVFQGLNSGCPVWWHMHLSPEPSHWPSFTLLLLTSQYISPPQWLVLIFFSAPVTFSFEKGSLTWRSGEGLSF